MKIIVVFAAALAVVAARPSLVAPVAYTAPIVAPVAISSQYQAQDELGQYNYGYANPLSSKAEVRTVDGVTRGAYSYLDAEGRIQSAQYVSDANGFRVAASNLPVAPAVPVVEPLPAPVPVEDTPEVVAARNEHLAAVEEARARAAVVPAVSSVPAAVLPTVSSYAYGIGAPLVSSYATYGYAVPSISAYIAPVVLSSAAAPAVVDNSINEESQSQK